MSMVMVMIETSQDSDGEGEDDVIICRGTSSRGIVSFLSHLLGQGSGSLAHSSR